MEENRIGFDENVWVRWGAVSERPDFISLFPNLFNKNGERSLLFILIFLLMSIYLLSIPVPLQGAGDVTHGPCAGAPALGVSPVRAWLGWEKASSSPWATGRAFAKRLCQDRKSLLAFIPEEHVGFTPWRQGSSAGSFLEQNRWVKEGEQRRRTFKLPPLASMPAAHRSCQSEFQIASDSLHKLNKSVLMLALELLHF